MARVGGGGGGGGSYLRKDLLPFTGIVALECCNVGLNTLFKTATANGLNYHVFVIYSYGVAALFLLPSPFCSYRSRTLPPLSFSVMWKIFLLGFGGCVALLSGYTGLNYSSPTLASAMSNLVPTFTFIFSVLLRMEKLDPSKKTSRAKVVGTIVSILGACVITLYKGPKVISWSSSSAPTPPPPPVAVQPVKSADSNWVIGGVLLAIQYLLCPLWYIGQAHIMREYPSEPTVIFFYNVFVSMLSALVACVVEPDFSKWKLGSLIAVASVVCQGFFGSCCNATVQTWVIRIKGPVYVAMFKPLSIAIAVIMGVIFLGDTLYLGSVIGAITVAIGFYTVMWGKTNEQTASETKEDYTDDLESSADHKVPLMQSCEDHNTN